MAYPMPSRLSSVLNKLSLKTVLTIPFVLQVTAAVGIVGYLSFKSSQMAVNDLASQLREEVTARILQQLEITVEVPHVINQMNANALLNGDINILTGEGEHLLWQQARLFPSTNLIYCGQEADGAFLGVGRSEGGTGDDLSIQASNPENGYLADFYDIGPNGQRAFLRFKGDRPYDPRIRPWYEAAKAAGRPTWSEIYLDFEVMLPTITAAIPIYSQDNGELRAVCATDIILSEELNTFLRDLQIGQTGIAYIAEPSGLLVASSTPEPIIVGTGEETTRISALDSDNPLIRQTTNYLSEAFAGFENVTASQEAFRIEGDRQFIETARFTDNYGLDWIVVLVVPEDDFMQQVNASNRVTLLASLVALLIAILLGALITQWLTRPLFKLNASAKEIARGEWDQAIALERADEIGELSRALASMARQLRESFTTLEQRVEERTQELQRLAQIDPLTQLANRRHFDSHLEQEWKRLARDGKPLTLLLCDVDYFKPYNDTYGHQEGDRCLREIANILTMTVKRPADLVARYGGEEFALILPDTNQKGGIYLAEKLHLAMRELQMPHTGSPFGLVTVSCGIATVIPELGRDPQELFVDADQALYAAKAQGRDRYAVADIAFPE
jgi:diguanylate cyclase (GGDEF)-like protein